MKQIVKRKNENEVERESGQSSRHPEAHLRSQDEGTAPGLVDS